MDNKVFNSKLELYCLRYISKTAPVPKGEEYDTRWQTAKMRALVFEQLMLFDKLAIQIDRTGIAIVFLIQELGLNSVEELLEKKVIELVLWTPLIFTSRGMRNKDGSYDESSIIGQPPLVAGNYIDEDLDPNLSLDRALSLFPIHKDRKRIFKRIASKNYIYPDSTEDKSIAGNAVKLTIDAYNNNYLSSTGLPFKKDPNDLNFEERNLLAELSHDVLETTILGELKYSSYEQYKSLYIASESIKTIESGLKVSNNTSEILLMENLPNLQNLIHMGVFHLKDIMWLRDRNNVEQYRNWINKTTKADDYEKISTEYIDSITGKNKFADSNKGKLLRTLGMYGIGTGIGALLGGPLGGIAGGLAGASIIKTVAELGLGLFDTFTLDSILKGWNPRMFTDEINKLKEGKE
jgi:hypothetical protein